MTGVKHSSGLLTGPEPDYEEEKTAGQLDDERQTSIMARARSAYDEEIDETPAIERQLQHDGVIMENQHPSAKPKLEASASFATEMHQIQAAERAAREKQRQKEEAEEAKRAARREKELELKLKYAQELDPEVIAEDLKEQTFLENQKKLYPDAKPVASDTDQRIWEKGKDDGTQIAGQARLESVFNSELHRSILFAIAADAVGFAFTLVGLLLNNPADIFLKRIFLIIGICAFIFVIGYLTINANKTRHREVPSDQARLFMLATAIPGVIARIPLMTAAAAFIPIVGKILGPAIGCAIGASFHYAYLNHFSIRVSPKDTLINTFVFVIVYGLSLVSAQAISGSPSGLIDMALMLFGFFFGDLLAMRLAYISSK